MKRVIAFSLAALMLLFCACCKTAEAKPLADVFNDIKAQVAFENITELKEARQLDRRYGITEDMVAEFAGCNNATGGNQEEIVLIKAADETKAAAVKEKLDKRYESKLNQSRNYDAEQAAIVEKCSVTQDGLYVAMIVSDKADKITEIYRKGAGLQ